MSTHSNKILHIDCQDTVKLFHSYTRFPGICGIFRNFFYREKTEFVALKKINLKIHKGEFVGLIGTNGAGKTTLVKCLTGIIPVSQGAAKLFGSDCFSLSDTEKSKISLVMGQRSQLWWDIPAIDSFKLLREIYKVPFDVFDYKVKTYSERLEVSDRLSTQLRQLSLGQRMKMEIIGAFLHDPEIVFLDEPTIGLDLISQEVIRQFLLEINREQQVTILLTSHDMVDIEQTCERLVILDSGEILFDGDIVNLQKRLVGKRSIQVHLDPTSSPWTPTLEGDLQSYRAEKTLETSRQLNFVVETQKVHLFIQFLLQHLVIRDLTIERESLEHLILEIFKKKSMDETILFSKPNLQGITQNLKESFASPL
jgi:ABC-2 type transport system ATP-binding protein